MTAIYVLLVAHFVADFICQTDWMALNKSKRWDALALHVWAYMAVMFGAMVVLAGTTGHPANPPVVWLGVNAAAHFVQDAITSRINSRLWFIDGARIAQRGNDDLMAITHAMDTITADEAYLGIRHSLHDVGGLEVAYNDKRHWFFVGIGADQLLHYITLFVTAGWWLQ